MRYQKPWQLRLQQRIWRFLFTIIDGLIWFATHRGLWHASAAAERRRYRVTPDVSYVGAGANTSQRLDIYQPVTSDGPAPIVMYIHGGGFNMCSRKTHEAAGHALASRGYLVFMVDYRRAPEEPYPSAPHDVSMAYLWITRNARHYGGDLDRLHVAGESAGGNLVSSVIIGACYRRSEPWLQRIWDTGVVPRSWHPLCAYLKVTEPSRYAYWSERGWMGRFAYRLIRAFAAGYLQDGAELVDDSTILADPVRFFETHRKPDRPLPPAMLSVGDRDVIRRDTSDMQAALEALGMQPVALYYPGQIHAFQLLLQLPEARNFWQQYDSFLRDCEGSERRQAASPEDAEVVPAAG